MDGIDGQLLIRATAAAGLAKTAVDIVRTQQTLPSWVSPASAWLLSTLIIWLLAEASGAAVDNRQAVAGVILGGFIALPMAIGATALQSVVERRTSDERIAEVADINVERAARAAAEHVVTSTGTGGGPGLDVETIASAARMGAQTVIDELRARTAG